MTSTTRPWDDWEDLPAGMYRHAGPIDPDKVQASADLLSDEREFASALRQMIRAWPVSAWHNLHLPSGRNAWLGQAACCYRHKATALETRAAWGMLPNAAQRRANATATMVAEEFVRRPCAETLFDD